MISAEQDMQMRYAAFDHVRRLSNIYGDLTSEEMREHFKFKGKSIPITNIQQGIFKPQQMRYLLSIKTVFPVPGRRIRYDDQKDIHRKILEGNEMLDYAFMGDDPEAAQNQWLLKACEDKIPIIYFLGVAPSRYDAIIPAFISDWDARALKARVCFGLRVQDTLVLPESVHERRYTMRKVQQRLHQGLFREAVITAYGGRCALSGLPERRLLDAAHIIPDKEKHGQPVVQNGLLLSKTHHAAFDAHMIGIDPDYQLHVSDLLLDQKDGPMLEGLKQLDKKPLLYLPVRKKDYPDRDRLAKRFEQFEALT